MKQIRRGRTVLEKETAAGIRWELVGEGAEEAMRPIAVKIASFGVSAR
jgi:hypothetical protein